jgi:hypothetical protein
MTNVGDCVANASNFFHRNRADAISYPQVIPDLGSVEGVPTMGGLIIDTNDVAGTCPMLLEHNLVKNITG